MAMAMLPEGLPAPPPFPYERFPYSHIHPNLVEGPEERKHVLFRGHDCWCEPAIHHIYNAQGRTVAITVIHNIWSDPTKKPAYPKLRSTPNGPL